MTAPQAIRPARVDEAATLAALHVRVWRETYVGIAPPGVAEALDEAHRLPGWQAALARRQGVLVAEIAGGVAGVVCFGTATQAAFDGRAEVKHLYVEQWARGHGTGGALLRAAFADLASGGWTGVGLAVVAANVAARRFYAAQGGREIGRFRDAGPLWPSDNLLVAWDLPRPA